VGGVGCVPSAPPWREPLALEHERFRDAILGVGSEHVTMDEALDNLRVVEAILSSAASGRSVDL